MDDEARSKEQLIADLRREVEERRQAIFELEQSEQRFRDIAETASEWFWEQDANLRFTYISVRFFEITGIDVDRSIGQTRFEFISEREYRRDPQKWAQHEEDLLAHRPFRNFTYSLTGGDGGIRSIRIHGKPRFDSAGRFLGYIGSGIDITEQVAAESALAEANALLEQRVEARTRALSESERRQRDILDNSPAVIYMKQPDGRYLFVNQRFVELFNLTREQMIDKRDSDIFASKYTEALLANDRRVMDERRALEFEEQVMHADGVHDYISVKFPLLDAHGEIYAVCGISTDITERKQAERASRRMADAIEALDERVALYDAEDRFVMCNGKFREVNAKVLETLSPGVSFESMLRAGIDRGLFPNSEGRADAWLSERLERHRNPQGPFELYRQDGMALLVVEQRLADGSTVIISTDITAIKRAREERDHLRNLLTNVIDSMPSVLVSVDIDGYVTQWNRQAQSVTGISAANARGQLLERVYPVLSGQLERVRTAIRQRQPQQASKVEQRREGEICFHDITVYPLVSNGVEGAVIRVDDVTERVRLEEMMIQSEKMLSVGGLAAGMAHEINNPLAGILQNAQILKGRLDTSNQVNRRIATELGVSIEDIQRYADQRQLPGMVDAITASGRRAARIVENMLSFARKGGGELQQRALGELLDQTLELAENDYDLKKRYDFRKIEIERDYQADAPRVHCDPGMVQQVFLNILRNGAEAMAGWCPQQGVTSRFRLRVGRVDEWLQVEIEDNGPGMNEETRRRAFDPFFTTKEVGIGTGLGLSVSYFIIREAHAGDMLVESEPGAGSRFLVRFPLQSQL